MRAFVGVKRVVDWAVKTRINAAGTGVELSGVKHSMNPFCEIAMEEAVRLKEKKQVSEIVAVSIGPKASAETLRTALAMGADSAVHIETDMRTDQEMQPLAVAKVLAWLTKEKKPDIWILGKQSIDDDCNQTGQLLAGLLEWPQGTFASKIEFAGGEKPTSAKVTREVDGGLQTIEVTLPCVFTADLRLNEPRYATLPNIMKAKKKPLETMPLPAGVDVKPRIEVISVAEPPARKGGKKVASLDDLLVALKGKGLIA